MPVSQIELSRSLARIEYLLRLQVLPQLKVLSPTGIGEEEQIDSNLAMEVRGRMAHFMKVRQHLETVPAEVIAAGVTEQKVVIKEDGIDILTKNCGFDPQTGEEPPDDQLPVYWAEVGKTITKAVSYLLPGGLETPVYTQDNVQEDNYTAPAPPVPGPNNIGPEEQIDEVEADTRPTT